MVALALGTMHSAASYADGPSLNRACQSHSKPGTDEFDPERALSECVTAANAGDTGAAWAGGGQNLEQAARWCRVAAERGHAAAARQYANMLLDGLGVSLDSNQALGWMERAAALGSELAADDLKVLQGAVGLDRAARARAYHNNAQQYLSSSPPAIAAAVKWMQRSADLGFAGAQLRFGQMLLEGAGLPAPQPRMAAFYFLRAARQGNAEAAYSLATLVLRVTDDDRERAEAIRYLIFAVEGKFPQAMYLYGKMLRGGDQVTQNIAEGNDLIKAAAEVGLPEAMFEHGLSMFREGVTPAAREDGLLWIDKAAEANIVEAQTELGRIYKENLSFQNFERSRRWLSRAAFNGSTDACMVLGRMEESQVGSSSVATARGWFLKSAELGDARGALALARSYHNDTAGNGSSKLAYQWANIATSYFPENTISNEARMLRDELSKSISEYDRYHFALEGLKWLKSVSPRRYSQARLVGQQPPGSKDKVSP